MDLSSPPEDLDIPEHENGNQVANGSVTPNQRTNTRSMTFKMLRKMKMKQPLRKKMKQVDSHRTMIPMKMDRLQPRTGECLKMRKETVMKRQPFPLQVPLQSTKEIATVHFRMELLRL